MDGLDFCLILMIYVFLMVSLNNQNEIQKIDSFDQIMQLDEKMIAVINIPVGVKTNCSITPTGDFSNISVTNYFLKKSNMQLTIDKTIHNKTCATMMNGDTIRTTSGRSAIVCGAKCDGTPLF